MIYILLAAYNEENDLPLLLQEFSRFPALRESRIIVVDDGSTDATAERAGDFGNTLSVDILRHSSNRGLGEALETGFSRLRGVIGDSDILVTLDADNTHPVDLISVMEQKILSGCDMVIASRFCPGGKATGVPLARRVLSRTASLLMQIARPVKGVRDYSSGYRAFSGRLVRRLHETNARVVTEKGFAATLEILLKAGGLTDRIAELPLPLHYERKTGKSKMRVARTVFRYLALLTRFTCRFDK